MASGTVNNGNRERSDTSVYNTSTDYSGARPKEQRGSGKGGYQEITIMEENGARHKERAKITDANHSLADVSSKHKITHNLSYRLYDVLDSVGASALIRTLRQDCAISKEIIQTLTYKLNQSLLSSYILGSSSEGSTTPGLNSDSDILFCDNEIPVIANIKDAKDGLSLFMIRDSCTQPGYVKLQRVYNKQPQTLYMRDMDTDNYLYKEESNSEGNICIKHVSSIARLKYVDERNGPADTATDSNTDYVRGFRCSKIPEFSREWIGRKRLYKWPSKNMIDKMANMGCFFVGVGHPTSKERHIEWRLSFSLQEREMMFSMNIVQHKCYIVLKMIKKDLIEPLVGKSISSYHLKTCMFHTIENTKSNIWKKRKLVQCVLLCLHVLLKWVTIGYCPNYFIKEENMFDRDLQRKQRLNLIRQINVLLSSGCKFLFTIKVDQIGALLSSKSIFDLKKNSKLNKTLLKQKLQIYDMLLFFNKTLCFAIKTDRNISPTHFINMMLTKLSQTKSIKDHTKQQTQKAIAFILPLVHLRLAQSMASLAFNTHNVETKNVLLKESGYHLRQGSNCDLTSATLLNVTVFYKLENYERCIGVLNQLESKFNENPISMCLCYQKKIPFPYEHINQLSALSVPSIISRITTCVMFVQSDMSIIPEALQYEMYRSVNTPPESRHECEDEWFDIAVVDAIVYLHMMQYLVNAKLNKLIPKHLALNKLESVLKRNDVIGHRETGYNILGWIHFQEGWIHKGMQYFRKSWSIRSHHNASKLHIMSLLRDRTNQT